MTIKDILLSFLFIFPCFAFSQSSYLAGTSQAGIEPEQSLISLNLTGYGYPRDGRFTLQWIKKGELTEVNALGAMDDQLCLVSNGNIVVMNPANNKSTLYKGVALNIRSITGLNHLLYAINNHGDILKTRITGGFNWEKKGAVDKSATLIVAFKNRLFVADRNGAMWTALPSNKDIKWTKVELTDHTINNIISLAANDRYLYALTDEGVIFQRDPGQKDLKWIKIARRNGETINEEIKHIAIVKGKLFGIDRENLLYSGEHRSEGNLSARAMAIKSGDQTVVIVNVDLCGLTDAFTGLVKKEIFLKDHIPASAIFINITHTHFAPVSQDCLTWQEHSQRPDSIYLYSTVKKGIVNSIENALRVMKPATLSFGRGTTDIGYNRSLSNHPELYDNAVDVVKVKYKAGNSESYLFLTACHPVFSTAGKLLYTLSANYPGVARKLVEERTGTGNSLFLQGTAGDIDPKDNGEYITGEKLTNEVIAVLHRPMTEISGPISSYLDTINIPVTPWTKEKITAFRSENLGKTGDVYAEKNVKWCDLMYRYYQEGTMPRVMPVYINTINIGNWKLVGFSRETTTGYGFGVKKLWPQKLISVAGYTNDVSSYLPTHMHLEAGVYEGKDSYLWDGMPNAFPQNADEIILGKIKSLAR